jgi:hypothetical protein
MKTIFKTLFIAVAAFSFSFAYAQDNTKTPAKKKATHHAKKKVSKKATTGTSSKVMPKEKPVNAAVDQKSMPKSPAGGKK